MFTVFINYRRSQSAGHAGRLCDRLRAEIGPREVFFDVRTIPPGSAFPKEIRSALNSCSVLLVLIGPGWLTAQDDHGRRLKNPKDFVRLEIETALKRRITVIPVLLQGATMPEAADLPESLAELSDCHSFDLHDDPNWDEDVHRLVNRLNRLLDSAPQGGGRSPSHADSAAETPASLAKPPIQPPRLPDPHAAPTQHVRAYPRAKGERRGRSAILGSVALALLLIGGLLVQRAMHPSPDEPVAPGSGPSTWTIVAGNGSGQATFRSPSDIKVDHHGNLLVSDFEAHRIQKLSPTGQPLAELGATGTAPGQFMNPAGIALDDQDNLFVADFSNHRVQKLSPSGQPLAQWGTYGSAARQFINPAGVALDGQGNIYVADMGNNRIQKLSPTGQPLAQWGMHGTAPGQFASPVDVALDVQGNVYVADMENHRIQKLSPTGQQLAQWGKNGKGLGQFDRPNGVAIDQQGNIYVADSGNDRVQKLSPSGAPLAQWGAQGTNPGQFMYPAGIVVTGQNEIFVTDAKGNQFKSSQRRVDSFPSTVATCPSRTAPVCDSGRSL